METGLLSEITIEIFLELLNIGDYGRYRSQIDSPGKSGCKTLGYDMLQECSYFTQWNNVRKVDNLTIPIPDEQ